MSLRCPQCGTANGMEYYASVKEWHCFACGHLQRKRPDGTATLQPKLRPEAQVAASTPIAIASSSFKLFGVEIKYHVLSDGQRIIEADSVQALLEAMAAAPTVADAPITCPGDSPDIEAFAKWQRGIDP